jgi:Protein of unknown function (DUF1214)
MPIADHRFVNLPLVNRSGVDEAGVTSPAVWRQQHYCEMAEALIFSNRYDGIPCGSVDLYIGPKAPAGQESNWIYTPAGKMWFPWFRLYGPEKAVFNKTWKLPDIEQV